MSKGVLLLAVLTIESSYIGGIERAATRIPDTLQFYFGAERWRIRTFAIDHDIHVHRIGGPFAIEDAAENIENFYSEVTERTHWLKFDDADDVAAVTAVLRQNELPGTIETNRSGVAFYNPDGGEYGTKSESE